MAPSRTLNPPLPWQRTLTQQLLRLVIEIQTGCTSWEQTLERLQGILENSQAEHQEALDTPPNTAIIIAPLNPKPGEPIAWVDDSPIYESDYSQEIPGDDL